jgi:DNA-directed RNA polymerase specialized sigma24 family protein
VAQLGEFPNQHELRIARQVSRRLAHGEQEDANQDALIAIWLGRPQLQHLDEYAYYAFCRRRAYFAAVDGWRHRNNGRRKTTPTLGRRYDGMATERGPEDAVDIQGLAAELAKRCKEPRLIPIIIMLSLGFSKQEIADRLGLHPTRISQLLLPAKEYLRQSGIV